MSFDFEILAEDKKTEARVGKITTAHGEVETPVFIPVATKGAVRTLTPEEVKQVGAQMVLGNAYHLYLRPGVKAIKASRGLHKFMRWDSPILVDSGGYQIFSLSKTVRLSNDGVEFTSIFDGSTHFLKPEDVIEIEHNLGADIIMVLDECISYPAERKQVEKAVLRSLDWAKRCKKVHRDGKQTLFGIIQGGVELDLREMSIEKTQEIGFKGYGIGGFSVGEPHELMFEMLDEIVPQIDNSVPRYLMGIGNPTSILKAVSLGIDMFDSALPTRVARNGLVFTSKGKVNIRNARYKSDLNSLDSSCNCYVCKNYPKVYLHHLFKQGEILAHRLLTMHNLHFMFNLMRETRNQIKAGNFSQF